MSDTKVYLITTLIIVFVLAGMFYLALLSRRYDCKKTEEQLGYKTEYHFWGVGCLMDVDGEKIPYKRWINNTGN